MKQMILAALVAAFFSTAATAQECMPFEAVAAAMDAAGVRYARLNAPGTRAAGAWADDVVGAAEPAAWDVAVVAVHSDGGGCVLCGRAEAICARNWPPPEAIPHFLRRVYGWRA